MSNAELEVLRGFYAAVGLELAHWDPDASVRVLKRAHALLKPVISTAHPTPVRLRAPKPEPSYTDGHAHRWEMFADSDGNEGLVCARCGADDDGTGGIHE